MGKCDNEVFVDGIGQIHFIRGLVRFDLISLEPDPDGKDPTPTLKKRIIMPPEGFLNTFNTMQQLIDQLLEAGVLKKTDSKKEK